MFIEISRACRERTPRGCTNLMGCVKTDGVRKMLSSATLESVLALGVCRQHAPTKKDPRSCWHMPRISGTLRPSIPRAPGMLCTCPQAWAHTHGSWNPSHGQAASPCTCHGVPNMARIAYMLHAHHMYDEVHAACMLHAYCAYAACLHAAQVNTPVCKHISTRTCLHPCLHTCVCVRMCVRMRACTCACACVRM